MIAITTCIRSFFSEANIRVLPQYDGIMLVHRGNKSHYQRIRQHSSYLKQLKNQKFYLYHPEPIDISHQMLTKNTKTLTYISRHSYQTVSAIPSENPLILQSFPSPSTFPLKQDGSFFQKLTHFLKSYRFQIQYSYLDLHPCDSYHKICSYMNIKKDQKIVDIFSNCKFNHKMLQNNVTFLSYLKQLHSKYLDTTELKLRKLNRIRSGTLEQYEQAVKYWKSKYMLEWNSQTSKETNTFKKKFAIQSGFGYFVTLNQLLEGYGEKSFYAHWKNFNRERNTEVK